MSKLILSLFPGAGLLDRAFEEAGWCVVRGPDLLWGGDIRNFKPASGHFWGVIGGPPCQDFSALRRCEPTGYGVEMLIEFARCVTQARPEWWLMENVARVPDVTELGHTVTDQVCSGYVTQRLDINQAWYSDCSRLRHIQFGSKSGRLLDVTSRTVTSNQVNHGAAVANDDRPLPELIALQGLPPDFDLPGMTVAGKKRAIGNGVPLVLGRVMAQAVKDAYNRPVIVQRSLTGQVNPARRCACGCGRAVTGDGIYATNSQGKTDPCRKRAQRNREKAAA